MAANNQKNSKNNSKYKLDPKKLYDELITQLDSIRSHVDVSSEKNVEIFNKVFSQDNPDIASLNNTVLKSDFPQESRTHAFYRLIGFPVISDPKSGPISFYSPGQDNVNPDSKYKYKVAAKQSQDFSKLSEFREHYFNSNIASIFSKKSIDSSVLALMSYNIREFDYMVNSESLDFKKTSQSYKANQLNEDSPDKPVYTSYTDVNGNIPTVNLSFDRSHIIKPFITDPRIELTVIPSTNRICVPFVLDKSQTKLREGVYLKQPFLEKVIRDRFSTFDQSSTLGEYEKSIIEQISSFHLNNIELVNNIVSRSDYYELNDQVRIIKYIGLIEAMCKLLYKSWGNIGFAQSMYHWVPMPASNGPEGGCTTEPVYIKDPNNLNSEADKELAVLQIKSVLDATNISTKNSGVNDPGGFYLESLTSFIDPEQNGYTGNVLTSQLEKSLEERISICDSANIGLKNIEMIMGEFSGLGLCDILAITAALYTVEKNVLLGFLDEPAFQRLLQIVSNTTDLQSIDASDRPDIQTTLDKFTQTVQEYYDIMSATYENIKANIGA